MSFGIFSNIVSYTLTGVGTEIPNLAIPTFSTLIVLKGTAVAAGNYAITYSGTPSVQTRVTYFYRGSLNLNGNTFTLLGQSITQAQLNSKWIAECIFNGSTWDVFLQMDFTQSGVISSSNIGNGTIQNNNIGNNVIDLAAKGQALSLDTGRIANLAVTTAKIDNLAVTTGKIDNLAVTDAKVNDVDGSKLAANSVANSKLAQMPAYTIKANNTAGSATPQDVLISTLIGSNFWSLTGNAGTTPGTNFIGTTDGQDVVFKRGSLQSGKIEILNTSFGWGSFISNSSGTICVAFGTGALSDNTSGSANSAFGHDALSNVISSSNNTGVGHAAGDTITTGANNTIVGSGADVTSSTASNRIALGQNAQADTDFQFALPDNVNYFKFRGNNFELPSADGAANTVLKTNGLGGLSFGLVIDAGTYTPTLTNVTNIDSSTAFTCQYMRVGSMVTVSGKVTIDPTASSATELGMSLPIASNLASEEQLGGNASDNTSNTHAVRIKADATNNRAAFVFNPSGTGSADYSFIFMYQII